MLENTTEESLLKKRGASLSLPLSEGKTFIVSEHFKVTTEGDLPIKWLGVYFTSECMSTKEEVVPMKIQQYELLRPAFDLPTLTSLGGREKGIIGFQHLFQFLKIADRSQGYICYVEIGGKAWPVHADWYDAGLLVEAMRFDFPALPISWGLTRHVIGPSLA